MFLFIYDQDNKSILKFQSNSHFDALMVDKVYQYSRQQDQSKDYKLQSLGLDDYDKLDVLYDK